MRAIVGQTVESVMVRVPVLHAPGLTVGEARTALSDPHRHLLLLVRGGSLVGTISRDDLLHAEDAAAPALDLATLSGRTVPPGACLAGTLRWMRTTSTRRLAVVDSGGDLLGLLCLKASGAGFCSDEGIRSRAGRGTHRP